jgi:hypothetical protein
MTGQMATTAVPGRLAVKPRGGDGRIGCRDKVTEGCP